MNESERRQHILGEDELEQVLRDFYEREVPEEFGSAPVPHELPRILPDSQPQKSTRRTAARVAAAIGVAGCLLSISITWREPPDVAVAPMAAAPVQSGVDEQQQGTTTPVRGAVPAVSDLFDVALFARSEPVDRQIYETADGPVEQRTDLVWTDVSYYEPDSGADVQWSLPTVRIKITPLTD